MRTTSTSVAQHHTSPRSRRDGHAKPARKVPPKRRPTPLPDPQCAIKPAKQRRSSRFPNGGALATLVIDTGNVASNADSWLGIAQATVADGQRVEVKTLGEVDDRQSGLVAGTVYYADGGGQLTSLTGPAARRDGVAVSDSKIILTQAGASDV